MSYRASAYIADSLPLAGLHPYVAGKQPSWFDWLMSDGWWHRMKRQVKWKELPRKARIVSKPRLWVRAVATFCFSIRELDDVEVLYAIRAAHAPREALLFDTIEWVMQCSPESIDEIEARASLDEYHRFTEHHVMAEVLLRLVRRALAATHGEDLRPETVVLGGPFACGFDKQGNSVQVSGSALPARAIECRA